MACGATKVPAVSFWTGLIATGLENAKARGLILIALEEPKIPELINFPVFLTNPLLFNGLDKFSKLVEIALAV